jgi:tetratricopeptide (TPR) repeat protein
MALEAPPIDKDRFLGREEALDTVLSGFSAAVRQGSTSSRACFIKGPSGVGKEHLLGELTQLALDEEATVLEAGEGSRSLGGMLPLIRTAVALGEGLVSRGLMDTMQSFLRDSSGEQNATTLSVQDVVELIIATTTSPTLYLVPSAHLQDPMTLNCVLQMVRQLTPSSSLDRDIRPPCFVALSYVQDGSEASKQLETLSTEVLSVDLQGLSVGGVTEFIVTLLGTQPLPSQQLNDLHRLTEGIPGRINDALFALKEAGELIEASGTWSINEKTGVELPDSPQEVIKKRIGALSHQEVSWLQTLSVERRPFSMAYALEITNGNTKLLHDWVARSILEQTWLETSLCLRFVSEDLRNQLQGLLAQSERYEAHEIRAAWIEEHLPAHEVVEHLARHWAKAGKPDRAISFFISSGQRSQSAGDLASTVEWYRRAMELLSSMPLTEKEKQAKECEILLPLGAAERANAEHLYAEERFRRLIELTEAKSDTELLGTALDRLALVLIETGRLTEAMQSACKRLEVAKKHNDPRGQAMALRLIGVIKRELEGPAAGIDDLEEALRVAGEDQATDDVRARVAIALSYAHTESGQPQEGLRWAMWGLKISRDAQFNELEVSFLINISMAQFMLGRPDLTLRWATEAMEFCEERGLKRYHILALGNAGDAMRALGHFTEAEQTLRAALRETYKTGGRDLQVARMVELAHLLMDKSDVEGAKTYLREAWRLRPHLSNSRNLLALGLTELRLRLGTLCSDNEGSCDTTTADLLASVMGWAATGTDTLPELELLVYAGLFQSQKRKENGRKIANEAYSLSEKLPPSRLISRPDLAAGLIALLEYVGLSKLHQEFSSRIARAIDARAASIDDALLRNGYLTIPLIEHLST